MSIIHILSVAIWAMALIASGLLVMTRCPGARAAPWYCAGAVLAAAVESLELALFLNFDKPMALKGLGMLKYGSVFSYAMMAVVFLPGMGMSKRHATLKAGIACIVAGSILNAVAAPRAPMLPFPAYVAINYLPYALLLAGSFSRGSVASKKKDGESSAK